MLLEQPHRRPALDEHAAIALGRGQVEGPPQGADGARVVAQLLVGGGGQPDDLVAGPVGVGPGLLQAGRGLLQLAAAQLGGAEQAWTRVRWSSSASFRSGAATPSEASGALAADRPRPPLLTGRYPTTGRSREASDAAGAGADAGGARAGRFWGSTATMMRAWRS